MVAAAREQTAVYIPEPLKKAETGEIYAMGGDVSEQLQAAIFRQLQGGGKVLVATLAAKEPDKAFHYHRKRISRQGVEIQPLDHGELHDPSWAAYKASQADIVVVGGGNQQRLFDEKGKKLREFVHHTHRDLQRKVYTTSAGTAALGRFSLYSYSYGDVKGNNPILDAAARRSRVLELSSSKGLRMDLLLPAWNIIDIKNDDPYGDKQGIVIDTHVNRGRLPRIEAAVEDAYRQLGIELVGVGIDADTGCHIVNGEQYHVLGRGGVYIVTGAHHSPYSVQTLKLQQGDSFNTTTREATIAKQTIIF